MEQLARARIVMWEGGGLWVVDATPTPSRDRTERHAHHAIQVTIAIGGRFRFEADSQTLSGPVVAIAADHVHVFEAEGLAAHLFIEPESRSGRRIRSLLFDSEGLVSVPLDMLGTLPDRIAANFQDAARDDDALVELGRALIATLAGDVAGDVPDYRVRRMMAWAAQNLDRPVGLADVVGTGDLSASRLRHLFVEQVGLPFRTYLLWLRLTRAVECFAGGTSLTEAAHEAGFADSAHFSRTFKRMFGIAPASLRMS